MTLRKLPAGIPAEDQTQAENAGFTSTGAKLLVLNLQTLASAINTS
jgi:hypothetical protein